MKDAIYEHPITHNARARHAIALFVAGSQSPFPYWRLLPVGLYVLN